jgi:hypothetical protein
MSTPPPIVAVVWEDATTLDEGPWVDMPDKRSYQPKLFYQVGFLLHDEPEGVTLVHAWSEDTISVREQIPRGMIRSIVVQPFGAKKRGKR